MSMNDMVGKNNSPIGEPKRFFGQIGKTATGKDADGNLIYADTKEPGIIEAPIGSNPGFRPVSNMINENHLIEQETKSKEYNEKIYDLNPKYSELIPLHEIIIRCKVLEVERSPQGLLLPPVVKVDIPTNSGVGKIGEVDSPYPYKKEAVIVAVPPSYADNPDSPYKVGSTVLLSSSPLKVVATNKEGTNFNLPQSFTHPDWNHLMPPTDMENEHYGYLMVSYRDCRLVLPNKKEIV